MQSGPVWRPIVDGPRLALLLLGSLGLSACLNTSMVVVGETPAPPLPPPPLISVAVVDEAGGSVAGAQVDFQGLVTETVVTAFAPGFHEATSNLEVFSEDPVLISLRPVVLPGRVANAAGEGIEGAAIELGGAEAISGVDGSFRLERVVAGEAVVSRPAWMPAAVTWDGVTGRLDVVLEPRMVKALHITGWTPQNSEAWNGLLSLADNTEINSLVVDLKDESGRVYYLSNVPLAEEVGATREFYQLADIVEQVEQHDLYMIGRIVTFQVPVAARARSDLAVRNADGTP